MSDKKYVTYEEFGAVGDGVTEDYAAIYKAHEYANANGLPVRARDGAHYYIHDPRVNGEVVEATVRTDVNWGTAKFTIDDRDVSVFKDSETYSWYPKAIFKIVSDYAVDKITDEAVLNKIVSDGLNRNTTRVDLKFDYPVMIIPYNKQHNVYRRRGYGGFAGDAMHEVLLLDKDGNISEETPVMFDYNNIDYIDVYRLDIKPITVEGGEFTTRSTRVNTLYRKENGEKTYIGGYIMRGLYINRSFVTLKNIKHYVTDEPTMNDQVENGEIEFIAACYRGFYVSGFANHVTIDGCLMTGRRCYKRHVGGTGGTYDLSGNCVNKIVFKNCKQTNFWITVDENNIIHAANEGDLGATTSMSSYTVDGVTMKMHWGVGGTNFCKNMEYYDSTLSRFDAHQGLYNGKIINCTVNYMAITGNGKFFVENTRWFSEGSGYGSNSLFHLRADYGSTWEGEIFAKNVKAYAHTNTTTYLFYHSFNNWYYGYVSHFPNISIDNLEYYDIDTLEPLGADKEVYLAGASVVNEPALHKNETLKTHPVFPDVDADGDGLVDGTNIPYDDVVDRRGVLDESRYINLNPVVPPKYIKLVNNSSCSVKIAVPDMSEYDGGFFGSTEFISGDKKCVGTGNGDAIEGFRFAPADEVIN